MKSPTYLKPRIFWLFLFLLAQAATVQAQKIEKVVFLAFGSSVFISYDLIGGAPEDYYTVDLYLSPDATGNYQLIPPNELSGDIGLGVRPGLAKSIQWQPSKSCYYPAASFKVKASYTLKDAPIMNKQPDDFMEMVYVEGGTFKMGSKNKDDYNASPVHQVTLSSFYIGKYEVTQKQWVDIMGSNPSDFKDCNNCPVENVSWNDVQKFVKKLNEKTKKHYRLPTEAEWEYAARGGNRSKGFTYSGGNKIDKVAWYEENSGSETYPIGQKQANELGIYDMSGNVWEWCNDWYAAYEKAEQVNPQGPATGSSRVHRGGSWYFNAAYSRLAYRDDLLPDTRNRFLGCRLAFVP